MPVDDGDPHRPIREVLDGGDTGKARAHHNDVGQRLVVGRIFRSG
jgi:hypothetical protein